MVLAFSFSVFADETSDKSSNKNVFSEEGYFKEVKNSMGVKTKENEKKTENEQKVKIKINYLSYLKIIIVLALVIGVIYLIFHFLKKALKIKNNAGENAYVITSQSLGPGKWIQVVLVHGKYLILGVTNDNINLISEISDPKEIERLDIYSSQKKADEGGNFVDVISDFFKRALNKKSEKETFDYEKDSIDYLKEQRERIDKLKE